MIAEMVRWINLRLDGHVDLKNAIDQVNDQRRRAAERQCAEGAAGEEEEINVENVQLPNVEYGFDVDITENSDEAEGSSFKVKFKGCIILIVFKLLEANL